MRKFLLVAAISIGLISCAACRKDQVVDANYPVSDAALVDVKDAVSDVTVDERMHVRTSDWEFYLESGDWELLVLEDTPANMVFKNTKLKNIVALSVDDTNGTMQEFSLLVLRGLRESGATFVSSTMVKINGRDCILLETLKGTTRVFSLIVVDQGLGYVLACGGTDEGTQKQICDKVFNTFKLL